MNRGAAAIIAATLVIAATGGRASALDYWVTAAGNDSNPGTSEPAAWATLVHAAGVVAAGDTVHVGPGSYQGFYLSTSGTAGAAITFIATPGTVSINADNPLTPDGINLEGADYVVLDGFTVNARTRAGIRAVLADFVTIRNCSTGNNGRWGIFTGFTDDITIENNETYGAVDEHGIYVSNSSDRATIRDNHIYDNHANGIHLNGDASQGGDGTISGVLIERNVIHGNGVGGGSAINCDGVTDSIIRNNLLYDNHASGISLYRIDGATGTVGNLVVNNTIHNASDARWCININNGSTGNTVVNNILYNDHPVRGAITIDSSSRSGFTADFNSGMNRYSVDGDATVIDLPAWQSEGYGANSFNAVPTDHFVSVGSDYHLLFASPAVDAGTGVDAPADDLDGGARPVGAGIDLGAYEIQLLACNDGVQDPGEQCGEPGLSCSDPCQACSQCACVQTTPNCGDALVCGDEECETDGDCGSGRECTACVCSNAGICGEGSALAKPKLSLRSGKERLSLKGTLIVAPPWSGVDPPTAGIRFRIDHLFDPGAIDVVVAGGPAWKTNSTATKWIYGDKNASVAGIKRVVVRDRSSKTAGELSFAIRGVGLPGPIPGSDAARASVVVGEADECGTVLWNPPDGEKPRCKGDSGRITCR